MENHKEALRILKECFGEEVKNPLVLQTLIQIGAVHYNERNLLEKFKKDGHKKKEDPIEWQLPFSKRNCNF
jgi:hypothetical protein